MEKGWNVKRLHATNWADERERERERKRETERGSDSENEDGSSAPEAAPDPFLTFCGRTAC